MFHLFKVRKRTCIIFRRKKKDEIFQWYVSQIKTDRIDKSSK